MNYKARIHGKNERVGWKWKEPTEAVDDLVRLIRSVDKYFVNVASRTSGPFLSYGRVGFTAAVKINWTRLQVLRVHSSGL